MADKYKFAIIALVLIIVAVLAWHGVIGGDIVGAALFSVIAYATGQVVQHKIGGGAAKAILFFVVVVGLTMAGCAGWQTQAKTTGGQLQQCMMRAAQQCAIEAVHQLTCPVPAPAAPEAK